MRTLLVLSIAVLSACGSSSADGGSGTGGTAGSGTGGTAGSGTGGTAGSGTGGADGGTLCADIASKFAAALDKAKQCSLFPGTSSCTKVVKASLECGDYEFAEAANAADIAELDQLQAQWDAAKCDGPGSCNLGGAAPVSATCEGGGQGGDVGLCVTTY